MRNSQARRFVPSVNVWKLRYALRYVSCTRSSASARLRVMRMAAEKSCGAYCIASAANIRLVGHRTATLSAGGPDRRGRFGRAVRRVGSAGASSVDTAWSIDDTSRSSRSASCVALLGRELAEDLPHRPRTPLVDRGVPAAAFGGDPHEDDPTVVGRGEPLDQAVGDEAVDGACRRRPIHPQATGEAAHRAVLAVARACRAHPSGPARAGRRGPIMYSRIAVVAGPRRRSIQELPMRKAWARSTGLRRSISFVSAGGRSHVRLYATDRCRHCVTKTVADAVGDRRPMPTARPTALRAARARVSIEIATSDTTRLTPSRDLHHPRAPDAARPRAGDAPMA